MGNYKCGIPKRFQGGARDWTISKDDAAMLHAVVASLESKDPSTQVGACIYNEENANIATSFNQAPKGWDDDKFPYTKDSEDETYQKYPYIQHAEQACIDDAIFNKHLSKEDLSKCTMAVTLFPCKECARRIANSGIKKLIYLNRRPNTQNPKEDEQIDILFNQMKVVASRYSTIKQVNGLLVNYDDQENKPARVLKNRC